MSDPYRNYKLAERCRMQNPGGPIDALQNEEEWQKTLAMIQAGDRRASLISEIGHRAMDFYMGLEPDDFAAMAREMYRVCAEHKGEIPNRCRLRAGEALLNVMDDSVRVAASLARAKQTALLDHLEECLTAFFHELTSEEFKRIAHVMAALSREKYERSADGRLRAMEAIMRKVFSTLRIAVYSEQVRPAPRTIEEDDPRVIQARAELAEMDRQDELPQGAMRVVSA